MSDLDKVLGNLKKKFGAATINPADKIIYPAVKRIPTGSLSLDLEIGGGLPRGKVVMIPANESVGKTTIALHMVAKAQKLKYKAAFIDVEGTFDKDWAKKIGVDLSTLLLAKPDSGEMALEILESLVETNEVDLIILDSLAALIPKAELDKSLFDDPQKMCERAVLLGRSITRLAAILNKLSDKLEANETCVVLLNQLREKPGVMYGNPEVIPGGKAIKFFSSIIINLTKGKWLEIGKDPNKMKIGQEIKLYTSKNKTFVPFKRGVMYLYFEGEKMGTLDQIQELFTYGKLLNIIQQSGHFYVIEGTKINGADAAMQYLKDNPKTAEKIEKEVRERYLKERVLPTDGPEEEKEGDE